MIEMPDTFKRLAVDTAFIVAVCSGIFFWGGSVYFEELYSILGVPSEQLQITVERKLLFGSLGCFTFLIILSLLFAFVAVCVFIFMAFDNGRRRPLPWRTRKVLLRYRRKKILAKRCLLMIGFSFFSVLVWKIAIDMPSEMAKSDAGKFFRECIMSVFSYKNGDKIKGCYVGEGGEVYYVLVKVMGDGVESWSSVSIVKDGVKEVITPIKTVDVAVKIHSVN